MAITPRNATHAAAPPMAAIRFIAGFGFSGSGGPQELDVPHEIELRCRVTGGGIIVVLVADGFGAASPEVRRGGGGDGSRGVATGAAASAASAGCGAGALMARRSAFGVLAPCNGGGRLVRRSTCGGVLNGGGVLTARCAGDCGVLLASAMGAAEMLAREARNACG